MRKRLLLLLAVLLSLSLVAAACGDDGDTDTGSDTTEPDGTDTTEPDGGEGSTSACPEERVEGDPDGTKVGLLFDLTGRGDQSFNDAAACGMDRAATDLPILPQESVPTGDADRPERLALLADSGNEMIIGVGFLWGEHISAASTQYPDTAFLQIDGFAEGDNVTVATFAEHEGSYLVGVAAALTSETGKIGFIGGVEQDLIKKFEAGFVAGATAANPDIEIESEYITPDGDFTGFTSPDRAREIANSMYQGGADVIYHAAGLSGDGMFAAAREYSEANDTKVWGIGVDSDQYLTAGPDLQEYVLTSMLKRVDTAVYESVAAFLDGTLEAGELTFDLASDGVGYSTSGDFLAEDVIAEMETAREGIASGDIEVPTVP
jgi:basic membrane protein A